MSTNDVAPIPIPITTSNLPNSAEARKGANLPVVSLVTLAIIAVVGSMALLGPVIIPVLVAVFLFFVIRPMTNFLLRWKVPRWLTYILLTVGLAGTLYLLGALISQDVQRFATNLPKMQDRAEEILKRIPGMGAETVSSERLAELFHVSAGDIFTSMFGTAWHFIESILLVMFYLIFLLIDADHMPGRILAAFPTKGPGIVRSFDKISDGISRYLRIKTVISLGMAVTVGIILACFGVSNWVLWAFLTFLLNYITYIGSLIALVPPMAISLLEFQHVSVWLLLVGLLFVNRFIWIDFMEIRYTGQQLRINNVLLLFFIVFWGWFWGITGMVLAVPMISALRIILSQFDRTRSIAIMISED